MTCLEAQSHIMAFINDQLDMATLEHFLEHVNHCADCREELEVYYTLLTAMRLLDEDKELANQFSQELDNKLKSSADKIRKKKNARVRKRFYFLFMTIGFIIFSSISVTKKVLTVPAPVKPQFRLEYIGIPSKYDPVSLFVAEYDKEARAYVDGKRKLRYLIYQMLKQDFSSKDLKDYSVDEPIIEYGSLRMNKKEKVIGINEGK